MIDAICGLVQIANLQTGESPSCMRRYHDRFFVARLFRRQHFWLAVYTYCNVIKTELQLYVCASE